MRFIRWKALFVLVLSLAVAACALTARSTIVGKPSATQMAELWVEREDIPQLNLLYGQGGADLVPPLEGRYLFEEREVRGTHVGYDVRDEKGVRWSVKLGPEAQTEVVVSRLLWAVGFHQPPVYYLPHWTLVSKSGKESTQGAGRFRPKLASLKKIDTWAWHENPFVGTTPLRGLVVLMVIVNNWDLKTSQNTLYDVSGADPGPRRWYVVRDLGASLGRTRWFFPGTKNNLDDFEDEGFIESVDGDRVKFHYDGSWREPHLTRSITTGDVRWACERLAKLTDQQWRDAFQAGGYADFQAQRYIKRLRQKVADGLNLRAEDT